MKNLILCAMISLDRNPDFDLIPGKHQPGNPEVPPRLKNCLYKNFRQYDTFSQIMYIWTNLWQTTFSFRTIFSFSTILAVWGQ